MYKDIGKKIKTLAELICWIGIIISLISGCALMGANGIGILVIILGALGSWTGSFLLYGFGELVDNSTKIVKSLELIDRPEGKPNEENPNV